MFVVLLWKKIGSRAFSLCSAVSRSHQRKSHPVGVTGDHVPRKRAGETVGKDLYADA